MDGHYGKESTAVFRNALPLFFHINVSAASSITVAEQARFVMEILQLWQGWAPWQGRCVA